MCLHNIVAAVKEKNNGTSNTVAVKNGSLARTRLIQQGKIVPKSARIPARTAPITLKENNGKPADKITGMATDCASKFTAPVTPTTKHDDDVRFYHLMDAATQHMPGMRPGTKPGPLEVLDQRTGRIKIKGV